MYIRQWAWRTFMITEKPHPEVAIERECLNCIGEPNQLCFSRVVGQIILNGEDVKMVDIFMSPHPVYSERLNLSQLGNWVSFIDFIFSQHQLEASLSYIKSVSGIQPIHGANNGNLL